MQIMVTAISAADQTMSPTVSSGNTRLAGSLDEIYEVLTQVIGTRKARYFDGALDAAGPSTTRVSWWSKNLDTSVTYMTPRLMLARITPFSREFI